MSRFKAPQKAKRDANEGGIVDCLEAHGFVVQRMDQPVDLLVHKLGWNELCEVKNPKGKNRTTDAQDKFFSKWPGRVWILRNDEDVKALSREIQHRGQVS